MQRKQCITKQIVASLNKREAGAAVAGWRAAR